MKEAELETDRLCRLLVNQVNQSRRSRRDLGQELGLGPSMVSKILTGTVRLQLSYLLMIASAAGVPPEEFFALAYPEMEEKGPTRAELEEMIEESVREAFRRLCGMPEGGQKR